MRFRATIGSALVLTATWVLPVFAGSSVTPAEGLALDQAAAADLRSPSLAPASDQTVGTPGVDQEQEKAEKPEKPRKPDKAGGKTGKDQKQVAEADKKKDTGFEFVFKERPSFRYGDMFRLDLRLLVQADARQSAQDLESFGGKFLVQRRRFGIQGTLLKVFEYEVEKELDSEGAWRDVFVNVRPVPFVQVQGGKFKVPFGREELTSPRERDFVYRSLVMTEVAPQRAIGAMVHGRLLGRVVHYQVGVFNSDGENSPSVEDPPYALTDAGAATTKRSVAARVVVAPFREMKGSSALETLEFAGAFMPSTLSPGQNHFKGRTVFGYHFFPRTVYVNGDRRRLGAEVSWAPGPLSMQAEWVRAEEQRLGMGVGSEAGLDSDLPPLVTEGWYVAGTWVITGEKKDGGIKPKRPLLQGGFGAIELAARYDVLRVGAGDTSASPTTSPRAADVAATSDRVATVGINWYVNAWVKIQVDAIRETIQSTRIPVAGRPSFWSSVCRFQFSM